jgi:hypothetical protein
MNMDVQDRQDKKVGNHVHFNGVSILSILSIHVDFPFRRESAVQLFLRTLWRSLA